MKKLCSLRQLPIILPKWTLIAALSLLYDAKEDKLWPYIVPSSLRVKSKQTFPWKRRLKKSKISGIYNLVFRLFRLWLEARMWNGRLLRQQDPLKRAAWWQSRIILSAILMIFRRYRGRENWELFQRYRRQCLQHRQLSCSRCKKKSTNERRNTPGMFSQIVWHLRSWK